MTCYSSDQQSSRKGPIRSSERAETTAFKADIEGLRALGVSATEILEAVQASACFAYWVRFINALGIQLGNETIGMYGTAPAPEK